MGTGDDSIGVSQIHMIPSSSHEWHRYSFATMQGRRCQPGLLDIGKAGRIIVPQTHSAAVRESQAHLLEDVFSPAYALNPFVCDQGSHMLGGASGLSTDDEPRGVVNTIQ